MFFIEVQQGFTAPYDATSINNNTLILYQSQYMEREIVNTWTLRANFFYSVTREKFIEKYHKASKKLEKKLQLLWVVLKKPADLTDGKHGHNPVCL